MGRIASIDFGTVRIGVALSDERKIIAQPFKCLQAKKTLEATAQLLMAELASFAPLEALILGLPLHLDAKESPLSLEVRRFAEILKTLTSTPLIFWDERLTTAQVERLLKEADVSRKKRKPLTDNLVATLLLQTYLDT